MRGLRTILTILAMVAAAGTACAGYEEGIRAFGQEDYPAALREFKEAATENHAGALYYLGRMYLMAEGVPADYKMAAYFFDKAAAQGNKNAQFYLGALHYLGEGVPQDQSKAVKWYCEAAAQGDPIARYYLGALYASGEAVAKDKAIALAWFNLAAGGGSEPAKQFVKILIDGMTPAEIFRAEELGRGATLAPCGEGPGR